MAFSGFSDVGTLSTGTPVPMETLQKASFKSGCHTRFGLLYFGDFAVAIRF